MDIERLQCIDRYRPVGMICASPSASCWSGLFICILSAALACRASRQMMLSPRPCNSCTSHGVMGPVCSPTCASSPACPSPYARSAPGQWHTGHATACGRLVDDADRSQLPRNVQTNKPDHRTTSHRANRRATAPRSQHHGWPMPTPRLPDVNTCNGAACAGGVEKDARICHHPSARVPEAGHRGLASPESLQRKGIDHSVPGARPDAGRPAVGRARSARAV